MTPKGIPQKLGAKLKAIRLHLGYTLDQMAEAVGKTGTSRRTRVHEWEVGKRQPDLTCLLGYARLSGISTDILIDDQLELSLTGECRQTPPFPATSHTDSAPTKQPDISEH